jgi:hypothetical protein
MPAYHLLYAVQTVDGVAAVGYVQFEYFLFCGKAKAPVGVDPLGKAHAVGPALDVVPVLVLEVLDVAPVLELPDVDDPVLLELLDPFVLELPVSELSLDGLDELLSELLPVSVVDCPAQP